ncbi:amidohydrolase [Xylogone sp. PMI_703]|nr:amidohydrolase [Xylogone sp. PMI_703]
MSKTAIYNAILFDGNSLHEGLTVTIDKGLISNISTDVDAKISDANVIDAAGMTLLPGFIDSHVHLDTDLENTVNLLRALAANGVTTALDMGILPGQLRQSLRSHSDIADIRFVGNIATSSGSFHSTFKHMTKESLVDSLEDAARFVEDRVAEGADYIKIVADVPGPSQEIINKLSTEARKRGKLSVAHATKKTTFSMAQEAKVDIITHIPLDHPLDESAANLMRDEGRACVPTLVMAEKLSSSRFASGSNYEVARDSVALLHKTGVPILAGTDSNRSQIAAVRHGESFHHELKLLKDAGLSGEEVLRAGTSLPAKWFQLEDRGVIEVGKRADLVLVDGNPLDDISATSRVRKVWIAGTEVSSA